MTKRDGYESRKKYIDNISIVTMDNQHPSPEQGKVQRLELNSQGASYWFPKWWASYQDDDIV